MILRNIRNFNKLYSTNYSYKKNILPQKKLITHNILAESIENKITLQRDWKLVRQDIIDSVNNRGQYTKDNIDAVILGYCLKENKISLGLQYINFLQKENIPPTLAFIGKHFKFLYEINKDLYFMEDKKCKKDQEKLILKIYEDLRKDFPLLDSFSLENIIPAISLTSEWKKCLDLLKEIEVTAVPNAHAYSSTIAAAFLNKEEHVAWQLLEEMVKHNRHIENIVFLAYINSLRMLTKQEEITSKLEQMFSFFQNKDFLCEIKVIENLMEFTEKIGSNGTITDIKKGVCQNCLKKLEKFDLNNEEFEYLKNKMFEKVILGKDIFVKSNPQELKLFEAFIFKKQHFDVVLDGLNIAYSAGTKQSPQVLASLLASVVSHFAEQNKEVLVVGRRHMNRWPRDSWNYITENATVFLAQNISQDDPYLLYCALSSGKDTVIVTRDLMRSHKFLLKAPQLRLLFNRWLALRQYQLVKVIGSGKPVFRYPLQHTITTQKNGSCWHVPFKHNDNDDIRWLCLHFPEKKLILPS